MPSELTGIAYERNTLQSLKNKSLPPCFPLVLSFDIYIEEMIKLHLYRYWVNYALLAFSGSAHGGLPEHNKTLFSPEAEVPAPVGGAIPQKLIYRL